MFPRDLDPATAVQITAAKFASPVQVLRSKLNADDLFRSFPLLHARKVR